MEQHTEKIESRGQTAYKWIYTESERAHIAALLECDVSDIHKRSTNLMQPRKECECCGKLSGVDDIVQNAIKLGVHNKAFMLKVLQNGPVGQSPGHYINCSTCGTQFSGEKFSYEGGTWGGWPHPPEE